MLAAEVFIGERSLGLRSALETKMERQTAKTAPIVDDISNRWNILSQSKSELAAAFGWENYDPEKRETSDGKIRRVIARRNKDNLGNWKAENPSEVRQSSLTPEQERALFSFLEARTSLKKALRAEKRQAEVMEVTAGWSRILATEDWNDPQVAALVQKRYRDKAGQELVQMALEKRPDLAAPKEKARVIPFPGSYVGEDVNIINPVVEAYERTHGEYEEKVPLVTTKEEYTPPPWADQWIVELREGGTPPTYEKREEPLVESKKRKHRHFSWRLALAGAAAAGVVAVAFILGNRYYGNLGPRPTEQPTGESSIAANCPDYAAISSYKDWNSEEICKVAEASSSNGPVRRRPDGSTDYIGVLPVNDEALKRASNGVIDPVHLKDLIIKDPAMSIPLAHLAYEKEGMKAFEGYTDGSVVGEDSAAG